MKLAVIADIHGNRSALEAVLSSISGAGVDMIVNLGDHFSGPLDTQGTADLLVQSHMHSILGNHDRYLLEMHRDSMHASDRVACDQLQPDHWQWLKSLAGMATLDDVFLCHGTPESDEKYWLEAVNSDGSVSIAPRRQIEAQALEIDFPLILCAHTHVPRSVRLEDGRLIVNPGSVGCPGYDDIYPVPHIMQTGNPAASYAIVEKITGHWTVNLSTVPYDSTEMVALAKKHGRADWARAVATGWIEE